MSVLEHIIRAAIIGIGGTLFLDIYALALHRIFSIAGTNWKMVGRWIGHMPGGRFTHQNIAQASPVRGEDVVGWLFHYTIGIAYGLLIVAVWGAGWLERPGLMEPLGLALVLLVLPWFVLMPGLGLGLAGSRTPKPNVARLKSIVSHSVFGIGMYLTAGLVSAI